MKETPTLRFDMDDVSGHDDNTDGGEESKTQRKKRMTELQKMGEDLLSLNKKQLEQIDVPEPLLGALREYQRLPNRNEAKRRQLQFIGKLMRGSDHESIRAALEKLRTPDRQEIRRGQDIEQWGERLLSGSEDDIQAFVETWPSAERQTLRQLLRRYSQVATTAVDAEEERSSEAAKIQRRRLLDYIKTCID
ncbi:MAG: ribosome biogenesis factor YjgA [Pseudohongiella sp.]|uniref:ribosome biogenesis factor YjgA n=1 Tax=Pseudohongiella sp. TaxID=1979412 RepID=UPI0034A044B5